MILRTQNEFGRNIIWVDADGEVEIWEYPENIEITEEFISSEWERKKLERQELQNGTTI